MTKTVEVDYLVIGAGAMGMAFVDTLFTENSKASFAIVDRYHRPGGHWNKAYPFVRLHQPSRFYGVNSRPLGENKLDVLGWNKGLYELATAEEVLSYYTRLLTQRFLPSGRVTYYPRCEHTGDGEFYSVVTAQKYSVSSKTRIVDATFMRVKVPSMGPPAYPVAEGVELVTPNDLVNVNQAYDNYTVVGAGKTGIDACLWMLSMGIEPAKITWIMPRDSWFLDRSRLQPKHKDLPPHEGIGMAMETLRRDFEAVMAATSVDDLLTRLCEAGSLLRFSDKVWPTMYRCATVSFAELEQIQKMKNIVRLGRVKQITVDGLELEGGNHPAEPNTIYIDCTADGLKSYPPVTVFDGNKLTLQAIRSCQQVFSAAFIAHVEAAYDSDEKKNSLCAPISHPNQAIDWLKIRLQDSKHEILWDSEPKIVAWLKDCRLDLHRGIMPPLPEDPEAQKAVLEKKEAMRGMYISKLQKLLDDHEAGSTEGQ